MFPLVSRRRRCRWSGWPERRRLQTRRPERDQTGPSESDASYQLEHAAPVQQTWQIVVEAAIMVLQVFFSVVDPHHDQLFPGSEGA